jgi:hypothetical protein
MVPTMIITSVRGRTRSNWICSASAPGLISASASRRPTIMPLRLRSARRVWGDRATGWRAGSARLSPVSPRTVRPVVTARSTSVSIASVASSSAVSMRWATSPAAMLPVSPPISHTEPSPARRRCSAASERCVIWFSCSVRMARQAWIRSSSVTSARSLKRVPSTTS